MKVKSRGEAKDAKERPITNLKISAAALPKKEKNMTVVKKEKSDEKEGRVIECHICDFTTNFAAALKQHMGSAHGDKMFKCLQVSCGKRYPKKKQLLRHVSYKHRGEPIKSLVEARPEVPERHSRWCNECGKGFCNGSSLRMHMLLHSGEKPFSCNICGKGFVQKGNMLTHESKCTEAPILSNENGKDAEKSSEDDTDIISDNLEDDTMVDDVDVLDDGANSDETNDDEMNDGTNDDGINDGINDDGINAANILEEVTLPSTFHESI